MAQVRDHSSDKPEEIWPQVWKNMSDKEKSQAKADWAIQKPKRDTARENRKLTVPVPAFEKTSFEKALAELKVKYSSKKAPACPIIPSSRKTSRNLKDSFGLHGMSIDENQFEYCSDSSDSEFEQGYGFVANQTKHREKVPSKSDPVLPFLADASLYTTEGNFGLVHLQLQPNEWKKIDKAKAAVQKEYDQLFSIDFVDMKNVREYQDVAERASKTGKTI